MLLTREQIIAANDRPTETVDVPEWGGSVSVRTMSGALRDRVEAAFLKDKSTSFRARVLAATLCGEDGQLLFTEADIEALGEKSIKPIQRVYDVAIRLNAVTKTDVDELEKN
jgi:hypothetical protein